MPQKLHQIYIHVRTHLTMAETRHILARQKGAIKRENSAHTYRLFVFRHKHHPVIRFVFAQKHFKMKEEKYNLDLRAQEVRVGCSPFVGLVVVHKTLSFIAFHLRFNQFSSTPRHVLFRTFFFLV